MYVSDEKKSLERNALDKIRSFTYTEALIPGSRQIKLDVKNTGKEVES